MSDSQKNTNNNKRQHESDGAELPEQQVKRSR